MGKNKTLIGDYLGTIEEYVPGKGTYCEEGKIYASNIGEAFLDRDKHIAQVNGKLPAEIEVGQIVFGEVVNMKRNNITVIVKKIRGVDGEVDIKTGLYVSNISDEYVEKPERLFGVGDIVKGKVIKINSGLIDLTTKGDLGVVKAFCKRCRHPLIKSKEGKDRLMCGYCGHIGSRKLAADYGRVTDL